MSAAASLFEDWCAARDLSPAEADPELFLAEVPAHGSTSRRRLAGIRRLRHEQAVKPGPARVSVAISDARFSVLASTLTVAAARDAFALAVLESGPRASGEIPGTLRAATDSASCRVCAASRWLRVLNAAREQGRLWAREEARRARTGHEHELPQVPAPLLVSLDRRGWFGGSLSARSLAALAAAERSWSPGPDRPATPRLEAAGCSVEGLDELGLQAEGLAEDALQATRELLKEMAGLDRRVRELR